MEISFGYIKESSYFYLIMLIKIFSVFWYAEEELKMQ